MQKRTSDERGVDRTAKRRHLYLVLDDCACGYSIRKVRSPSYSGRDDPCRQMAANVVGEGAAACTGEQRLPPPIFRFEAQRGLPMYFAAAFDSNIMALQPVAPAAPIYIPAGGRLFALADGSMELLHPPPSWTPPGVEHVKWHWRKLPEPPFKRRHVTSYGVHPDGRTIFVSTVKRRLGATFALDTAERLMFIAGGGEWKRRGRWALPFSGRAHFDSELGAWVGLSRDPESPTARATSASATWCPPTPTPAATRSAARRGSSARNQPRGT